jgi:hypothetical protein
MDRDGGRALQHALDRGEPAHAVRIARAERAAQLPLRDEDVQSRKS